MARAQGAAADLGSDAGTSDLEEVEFQGVSSASMFPPSAPTSVCLANAQMFLERTEYPSGPPTHPPGPTDAPRSAGACNICPINSVSDPVNK